MAQQHTEALETELLGAEPEALAKAAARATAEAVFARRSFDRAAETLKAQHDAHVDATAQALDTVHRQAGAQWKKHSDLVQRVRDLEQVGSAAVDEIRRLRSDHGVLSGIVGDLQGEVIALRVAVGQPAQPEAIRKSLSEAMTPEQIERLQEGSGLYRESYKNQAHRSLTAKRLALYAAVAYGVQTAIVVAALLLKG